MHDGPKLETASISSGHAETKIMEKKEKILQRRPNENPISLSRHAQGRLNPNRNVDQKVEGARRQDSPGTISLYQTICGLLGFAPAPPAPPEPAPDDAGPPAPIVVLVPAGPTAAADAEDDVPKPLLPPAAPLDEPNGREEDGALPPPADGIDDKELIGRRGAPLAAKKVVDVVGEVAAASMKGGR